MRPFPGRVNSGPIRDVRSGAKAHPGQRDIPGLRGSHPKARGRRQSHAPAPEPPLPTERTQQTTQRDRPASTGRHRRPPLSGNASGQRQAGRSGQQGTYLAICRITPIPGAYSRPSSETLRPGSQNARRPGSSQSARSPGSSRRPGSGRQRHYSGADPAHPDPGQIGDMRPASGDHPGRKVTPRTQGPQAFFLPNDPNKPHAPNSPNITSGQNPKNQTRFRAVSTRATGAHAARRQAMRSGKPEHPDKTGHPRPCAS